MFKNDLHPAIEIKYDSISLNAQIKGINVMDSIWSQIYLLFDAGSDNIEIISHRCIQLPWYEFRRILHSFAKYIKHQKLKVYYDEQSKKLIYNHSQDIFSLTHALDGKNLKTYTVEDLASKLSLKRSLTDAQLRDLSKLISLKHGANFSVPGAGKTTTLLSIYSILKNEGAVNKLLVIAPRNAFISWETEIQACFDEPVPKVVRLTGGKEIISNILIEDPEIALITYHQLPYVVEDVIAYLKRNSIHLVLDESHRIKRGMPSVHYSFVIKLADLAYRRDILTGTPLPQSTSDLSSQFEFLWPGSNVLETESTISDEQQKIDYVNRSIKPLFVRTTKGELGLKPPKIKTTKIKLGPVQSELYGLLRSEAARVLSGMGKEDIIAFRKLGRHVMRLLQVTSNPMLITSNTFNDDIETFKIIPGTRKWELLTEFSKYEMPAKIEYVLKRVRELSNEGKKVVIWSAFVQNIELLEKSLSDLGAVSIYGGIDTGDENDIETREGRIRRFHEDVNCKVLVANPAACGEGISLHKVCHYAIYLDRTFNAAHYLQSMDRIHRLGLSHNVTTEVEILLADDTIDDVVESRLTDKIRTMGKVLDDHDLRTLAYDSEDVIEDIVGGIDKEDISEIKNHLME